MKLFALLLVCSAPLFAQTALNPSQFACPASSALQVVIAQPSAAGPAHFACAILSGFTGFSVSTSGPLTITPTTAATTAAMPAFVDGETPTGGINGLNPVFVLANAPNPATSLQLFLNGVLQSSAPGGDYTLSGTGVTFLSYMPAGSDKLLATYRH
jgi:hypothetical protein